MKQLAVVIALCIAAGCGKVGDPKPPFIRIPQPVSDLKVQQNAYQAELSWTNPPKYVDGSAATDLATVHVFRNGSHVQSIEATAAGMGQSYALSIRDAISFPLTFAVQVETSRGKLSEISNLAPWVPVDVPGPVRDLKANVDQHRIEIQWQPPERNPAFAEVYFVHREDGPEVRRTETHFEDENFEPGKKYSYTVIAARGTDSPIRGVPAPALAVEAVDKKAPAVPAGLRVVVLENAAYLTWDANSETDLSGYFIYRGDQPDGVFTQLDQRPRIFNEYIDKDYRPGFYYKVSSVDDSRNESDKSPAQSP